jgi:D-alanyl-lipoteichoic acid acyltransferase DltB (MBOAT superfamily)
MTFNTFGFLGFFLIVMLVYFVLPGKLRSYLAALASLAFYALYDLKITVFLLIYILYVYFAARILEKKGSKPVFAAIVILALVPLLAFKYLNFSLHIMDSVLGRFVSSFGTHSVSLVVPLGISYFTFKSVGYLVDVYKKDISAERNLPVLAAFVSFFPEMLAGPIDRSNNLLKQLREKGEKKFIDLEAGMLLLFYGYFEKMCVADRLKAIVDGVYDNINDYNGAVVIVAIAAYSLEIYLDFAGCTHMALGVGKSLGFDLPVNFRQPYLQTGVAGFWRNWHISLMDWLKDYIYIPLGGSRKGTVRKYVNALIVFATSGLWHGAGLNYLLWGTLNGLLQIGGNILNPFKDKFYASLKIEKESEGLKWFKRLGTFILMSCTWVFFRAPSSTYALTIFKRAAMKLDMNRLFDGTLYTLGLSQKSFNLMLLFLLFVLLFDYACLKGFKALEFVLRSHYLFKCFIFILLVAIVVVFGIYGTAFDASSFIYIQY